MSTAVGVGQSNNRKSFEAGAEAARAALSRLDRLKPSVLIVFGTAGYSQAELLAGIREAAGPVPVVGCSAEGIITQRGSDETAYAVGVMAVGSDELSFHTTTLRSVSADVAGAGDSLARWVREKGPDASLLLLFVEGLMPSVTPLLQRLEAQLPATVKVVGGTSGDLFQFKQTWQYASSEVFSDGVSALLVSGPVAAELAVSHGCNLIGAEHTVTRADSGWVREIDGKPAWTVLADYLAPDAQGIDAMAVSHICFAEFVAPEEASFPGEFLVRVPVVRDEPTGALAFAAGMREGARIQMAIRSPESIRDRALASVQSLVARRPSQEPLLMLQVDCACRGALLFGDRTTPELMEPPQQLVGKQVPWLGFHSYGEIAPLKSRPEFHNYSAAYCALYATR